MAADGSKKGVFVAQDDGHFLFFSSSGEMHPHHARLRLHWSKNSLMVLIGPTAACLASHSLLRRASMYIPYYGCSLRGLRTTVVSAVDVGALGAPALPVVVEHGPNAPMAADGEGGRVRVVVSHFVVLPMLRRLSLGRPCESTGGN